MIETVKTLWRDDKPRFFLYLIPAVALLAAAVVIPGLKQWLFASAQRILEQTEARSELRRLDIARAEMVAQEAFKRADGLAEARERVRVTEDWHRK